MLHRTKAGGPKVHDVQHGHPAISCHQTKTTARHGLNIKGGDQSGIKQAEQSSFRNWDCKCSSALSKPLCAVTNCKTVTSEGERTVLWLKHQAGVRRSVFTAINFLFVLISCASVPWWIRGDHASPLPCLFCHLSGAGTVHCAGCRKTGLLWSVSVTLPPDNVGQKHSVQQAGQPSK